MKKILTSPSSFGKICKEPILMLENEGYHVINNPYGRKLTEEEVVDLGSDCIGIVAGVENLSENVFNNLSKLQCISRVGVGVDSIDFVAAKKRNISIFNTPDGPTRAVAELTIGLTFSLLRKIHRAHFNLKNLLWKKETGNLLFGKTIGIIGLGRIGKLVSEYFISLGNNVVGFDLYPDKKWIGDKGVELLDIEQIFSNADIITIHIPLSPNGVPSITAKEISLMKPNALLINVSRGGVLDEESLFNALNDELISGAAIDVFSEEPYTGPFCKLDNVLLTPHIGSYAKEGKLQMEIDAANNLIEFFKNKI